MDNDEVNLGVMNEGDMVDSKSEDNSDDVIFNYDSALSIAFEDSNDGGYFMKEEINIFYTMAMV